MSGPPKAAANIPATPASATASTPAVREPDPVLLDAIPTDSVAIFYVGLGAMRAEKEWAGLFSALPQVAPTEEWNRTCGFDVLGSVREGVVAFISDGAFVVALRLDGIDDARAVRCAAAIAGKDAKPTSVAGQPAVKIDEVFVAVAKEGVTLLGAEAVTERAAARVGAHPGDRAPLLTQLPKGPGPLLTATCDLSLTPEMSVNATYLVTAGEIALHVDMGLSSTDEATELANTMHAELQQDSAVILAPLEKAAAEGGDAEKLAVAAVRKLLRSASMEPRGDHMMFDLGMKGAPEEIAAAFGIMSATSVYGARRYLANEKVAEAKSTVNAIARALQAKMDADLGAAKKRDKRPPAKWRFPGSTGLTPPVVPAGTKFVPGSDTWSHATWRAIGFRIAVPIYYSYEIEVSKDGKSAVVRARGDLNADGVQSTFEIPLELGPDGETRMGTQLKIENEFE